jgi:hypothetical protein
MDDKEYWVRRVNIAGMFWRKRLLLEKEKGRVSESSLSGVVGIKVITGNIINGCWGWLIVIL